VVQRWRYDLRRLVAGIVDRVAKGFIPIEDARLEELLEPSDKCFGTTGYIYQVMDVVMCIQRVRPGHILIERI
jgi:hypothetical protein